MLEDLYDSSLEDQGSALQEYAEHTLPIPELIALPPLENTTYVVTHPFRGEWQNGHLLKDIHSFLLQQGNGGEASELILVANLGNYLQALSAEKTIETNTDVSWIAKTRTEIMVDEDGNTLLDISDGGSEEHQKAVTALKENRTAVAFISELIELQALARSVIESSNPQDQQTTESDKIKATLTRKLSKYTHPFERQVAELAVARAGQAALILVDATLVDQVPDIDFRFYRVTGARTIGFDLTLMRHWERRHQIVIGLGDVDTVPADKRTNQTIQSIFQQNPDLQYYYAHLGYQIPGTNEQIVASSPTETIKQARIYNGDVATYGSPQIFIRLSHYPRIGEIYGYGRPGFSSFEDYDTAAKALFTAIEGTLNNSNLQAIFLTSDRIDGSADAKQRADDLEASLSAPLIEQINYILTFKKKILAMIAEEESEVQTQLEDELEATRRMYLRHQKRLQRFYRLITNVFLDCVDTQKITANETGLYFDPEEIVQRTGGTALLRYLETNKELVHQLLRPEKQTSLAWLRYIVGNSTEAPAADTFSAFEAGIREYLGTVPSTEFDLNQLVDPQDTLVKDQRTPHDIYSLYHVCMAEIFSLSHIWKHRYDQAELIKRKQRDSFWPMNPADFTFKPGFSPLQERLQKWGDIWNLPVPEV